MGRLYPKTAPAYPEVFPP